ncbi:MAG: hypothetical protein LBF09_06450, partial [Odoribacteraceae bacterium]|nr:hypothetical protein [Odoribacteraceae bacterium]
GFVSKQRGIASLQYGFVSKQRGIASLQNGFASTQRGIASLQNGFASTQRGIASLQNSFASTQRGIASLQNASVSTQRGIAFSIAPSASCPKPCWKLPDRSYAWGEPGLRFPRDLSTNRATTFRVHPRGYFYTRGILNTVMKSLSLCDFSKKSSCYG